MAEEWVPAARVQKNEAGEFRAEINGQWVPATKAQKSGDGKYRVMLSAPQAPAPETSNLQDFGRQLGLTARAGISGLTAIPGMVVDAPFRLANLAGANLPLPSQAQQRLMTRAGLPEPESSTERVAQDVASGMAGAGGMVKLGHGMVNAVAPLAQQVGARLAAGPGIQTVSSATGAGAASVTRESGGGEWAQLAAALVGSVLPMAGVAGGSEALRRFMRGGEQGRLQMVDNAKAFRDAGMEPTVGQAAAGRNPRAVESVLSKMPGGSGVMARKAETEAANLGNTIGNVADDVATGANSTRAGTTIERGIKDFVERFKGKQEELYSALDRFIPKSTRVDVTETKNALQQLNAEIPGAPNVSKFFKNSKIQGIDNALKADTETTAGAMSQMGTIQRELLKNLPESEQTAILAQMVDGKLPYEALKKLRTLVGNEINNNSLTSDVPRSKWKALYGALSKDLEGAASVAGPDATKAFNRANTFTRAGQDRIESVLDRVTGTTPEKTFTATVNPTELKEGATTLQGVMKSLKPEERKQVAAAMINRLGRATPGNQDAMGDVFSAQTFLTNWNKLSPQARASLFSEQPNALRALENAAKVTSNIRDGSKVFANPSGTQPALSANATGGGALMAMLTGNPGIAAGIGGSVLAANRGANLMTDPRFVNWLSRQTELPAPVVPATINALSAVR